MKWISGVILSTLNMLAFAGPLTPATIANEHDFIDLTMSIESAQKLSDGSTLIKVANTLNDKKVGFSVKLKPEWQASHIDGYDLQVYWGDGSFVSEGAQTVEFVNQLSALYGLDAPKTAHKKEIGAQIVTLANDPNKLFDQAIKTKFFFSADNEDLYSEVFININIKNKTLEFFEKDPDYRPGLIGSLAGQL
jgi:hypothetical protein